MKRMIDTGTWDDPWFADLEPDAKLVFLYLLTNRRSTAAGAFEITLRAMAFETGIDQKRIGAILKILSSRVEWWPEHQIIWVRNFFKHQAANDNFHKSAQGVVRDLPLEVQCAIGVLYPSLVPDGVVCAEVMGSDTRTNGYATGSDTPDAVIDRDRDRDREKGSSRGEDGADAPSPKANPATKGTRLPDDFTVTDDMRQWAIGKGATDALIDSETEKFKLWWPAQPGQKGVKLDWSLTWKTWINRHLENSPSRSITVHKGGKASQTDAVFAQAARDLGIEWDDDDHHDVIDIPARRVQ